MNHFEELPSELISLKKLCSNAGISLERIIKEKEGEQYKAYRFLIRKGVGKQVAFRVGKMTASRPGNFVTLWNRGKNKIKAFDLNDGIDFVIVHVSGGEIEGQFIFDKGILYKKGIFSDVSRGIKGKLAFRVFPPWSHPAKTALKTQCWQLKYFLQMHEVEKFQTFLFG